MTATDPVDRLISAATATAERELTRAVRPPFAAVVARAHRLAPAEVPARWLTAATHPRPPDIATSARTNPARPTDVATSARPADARLVDAVTSSHTTAARPTDVATSARTADARPTDAATSARTTPAHPTDVATSARPADARPTDAATSSHTTSTRTADVATSAHTADARLVAVVTSSHTTAARPTDARLVDVVTSSHATAAPHANRTRAPVARGWIVPLLAAAVLLAFAVQRRLATRAAADEHAFQAGAQPDSAPPQPLPPPHATVPAQPLPETATPSPDPTHPPRAATRQPDPPPRARESLDALLARLDDEAEACMQLGDLACAEARYQEIVQRGGRRVQVELAFADRFHLARRRDDTPALRKLWAAYLARFPRGQFADDARGGLCRHDPDPPACWRAYLVDFPSGSFAAEAGGAAR